MLLRMVLFTGTMIYSAHTQDQTVVINVSDLLPDSKRSSTNKPTFMAHNLKTPTDIDDEQLFYDMRICSIFVSIGTAIVCLVITAMFCWITVTRLDQLYAPTGAPII
ncbi:hypothetical protein Tcan_11379 [Toxocara canis]|uniref:Uncharacterized protein n=1 Tax=Toxocara canis TaxID=6265 RepID=A0A0B2VUQ7_TOXCA|nr:hypothetical protein Tcan_11379 [Toxocara canis]